MSFRNTVVIMTSNLGAGENGRKSAGFLRQADTDAAKERMMTALKEAFRPEFLNRVDEIVGFSPLGETELSRIASLLLEELRHRMEALGVTIRFSEEVVALVAAAGNDPHYGARPLRRAVVRLIEDPLAKAMLEGSVREGDHVSAEADGQAVRLITK